MAQQRIGRYEVLSEVTAGGKIAFTAYRDINAEIYVMNANGSGPLGRLSKPL